MRIPSLTAAVAIRSAVKNLPQTGQSGAGIVNGPGSWTATYKKRAAWRQPRASECTSEQQFTIGILEADGSQLVDAARKHLCHWLG